MYFGGMPFGNIKAPTLKIVDKEKPRKVKQFDINVFLDKYLNEMKPPKTSYQEFLEMKNKERIEQEIEKQQRLKDFLHIRTFDEIQNMLS